MRLLRAPVATGAIVFAFLFELYGLFFPGRASFRRYPMAVPDPFIDLQPLRPAVLIVTLAVGIVLLLLGTKFFAKLVARPRRTAGAILLLGICLHLAMIGSLQGGFQAFHRRALSSGHREFLYAGVWVTDLPQTLRQYESFVQGRVFLLNKGPGVTAFFYTLRVVANSRIVKPLIEPVSPGADVVTRWLTEQNDSLSSTQIEQLRHLLGLMFVLFPVLTYLPVIFLYWLGEALVDAAFGLLAATLYLFAPSIGLLVAHLDTALFPLLVSATTAMFVIGVHRGRLWYVTGAAIALALYFTFSLAASAMLAFLVPYLGLTCWSRFRQGQPVGQVLRDATAVVSILALVCVAIVVFLTVTLHLDFAERYRNARAIQAGWTTSEYNFFWARADALGWFLSFGLAQALLLVVQGGRSLWRLIAPTVDAIDLVTVAWLCLFGGLLVLGRQHGETNRIWTFLVPTACLVVARLLYDALPPARYRLPLILFFVGLVLARVRLSYF